jgi:putative heme degradation protein
MIHEAIRTRLTSVSAVTALVSTRIYPNVLPQSPTLPALVYQRIDEQRETAMSADPGVVRARMQVSAWATTFGAARNAAEEVRKALQRYRGTPSGSGTEVLDVFIEDVRDMDAELVDGALLYRVDVDATMIYRE